MERKPAECRLRLESDWSPKGDVVRVHCAPSIVIGKRFSTATTEGYGPERTCAISEIWFTSDTHYGHANVIRYCNRPFANVEEMDDALVENFNERVKPCDVVYHLGDFSFARDPSKVFRRLNGNLHLIAGNHDQDRDGRLRQDIQRLSWGWIKPVYMLKASGTLFWLSHFSHRAWPKGHHGAIHLFGHSHGSLPDFGRSTDVGVDAQDYKPVHLDEILDMMRDRGNIKHH